MRERVKTIAETMEMLGVCRATVYNLLRRGELERAPSIAQKGRGKPLTMVTASSIVNYIKNN